MTPSLKYQTCSLRSGGLAGLRAASRGTVSPGFLFGSRGSHVSWKPVDASRFSLSSGTGVNRETASPGGVSAHINFLVSGGHRLSAAPCSAAVPLQSVWVFLCQAPRPWRGSRSSWRRSRGWRGASSPALAAKAISRRWRRDPKASLLTAEASQFLWGPLQVCEIHLMGASIH